jgi:CRISPR-associated protein Csb3
MSIRINVDPTNPGQFFACCGLLELADRLWPGAEGWFEKRKFCITCEQDLPSLVVALVAAPLRQLDPDDMTSSPIEIGDPFQRFRLDWWLDYFAGGRDLKVWAGRMESLRIAQAMQHALRVSRFQQPDLLDAGVVVFDPAEPSKKVEPFYFDARRAPNAHSRDVGFAPNDLQMTTVAFPAVELLCLIGLQRCLPRKTDQPRVFSYATWTTPVTPPLLAAVAAGTVPHFGTVQYRFENWYRTGQKKHKAFRPATINPQEEQQWKT